jgi:hypothetical protein
MTPQDVANAILMGPLTAERMRKACRHLSSEADLERVLDALPKAMRPSVEPLLRKAHSDRGPR